MNTVDRDQFCDLLRPLIEAAPLVVEMLYPLRPFSSYEQLVTRLEQASRAAGKENLIELINAHPRIGEKKTVLANVSLVSVKEQGLDREPEDKTAMDRVDAELRDLNREYEAKFGFRFVVFVNGRSKPVILEVMKERFKRSSQEEFDTAVPDMFSIMRSRIGRLCSAYKA